MSISYAILVAASSLLFQDDRADAQSIHAAPSRFPRLAGEESFDKSPSRWGGFQHATRLELTLLPVGSSRLRYGLIPAGTDPSRGNGTGEISASDSFLLREVERRFPRVDLSIVDVATTRVRSASTAAEFERALEATGSADDIGRLATFVDDLIEANRPRVVVECALIEQSAKPGDVISTIVSTVAKSTIQSLIETESRLITNAILFPAVSVFGGATAHIESIDSTTFVADFDIEIGPTRLVANPVIDVIQEGVVLDVTPTINPDGLLTLDCAFSQSVLKRPVATFQATLGTGGPPMTLELPEVSTVRWSSPEITMNPTSHTIRIDGIQFTAWDADGNARRRSVGLLLNAHVQTVAERQTQRIATVIGFDATEKRVFARLEPGQPQPSDPGSITIDRDGDLVGKGKVEQISGEIVVVILRDGEARVGDSVR